MTNLSGTSVHHGRGKDGEDGGLGIQNPILENWGAIQYSLEKYPEKYLELRMIFKILFKMFL